MLLFAKEAKCRYWESRKLIDCQITDFYLCEILDLKQQRKFLKKLFCFFIFLVFYYVEVKLDSIHHSLNVCVFTVTLWQLDLWIVKMIIVVARLYYLVTISNNVISSTSNRNISYHKRFGQKLILLKPFCL